MKKFHIDYKRYIVFNLGIYTCEDWDANATKKYIYSNYKGYYNMKTVLLFINLMERKEL